MGNKHTPETTLASTALKGILGVGLAGLNNDDDYMRTSAPKTRHMQESPVRQT